MSAYKLPNSRSMCVHAFYETHQKIPFEVNDHRVRPTHKQFLCTENMILKRGGVMRESYRAFILKQTFPPAYPQSA
jgi:hypothetical protein